MLDMLKILCRLSGIRRVFLITQRSNLPAVALYESARGRPATRTTWYTCSTTWTCRNGPRRTFPDVN